MEKALSNNGEDTLLVIFDQSLILSVAAECPEQGFIWGNAHYADLGLGDWTGFYDWLRNSFGKVLGVRFSPLADAKFVVEAVAKLPYVVLVNNRRAIEVYFSEERGYDPTVSGDQDFGGNRVFRSEEDVYALSFTLPEFEHPSMKELIISSQSSAD